MHPLAAIALVFLTGLAWTVAVLTLLIALAKDRPRARAEGRAARPGSGEQNQVE